MPISRTSMIGSRIVGLLVLIAQVVLTSCTAVPPTWTAGEERPATWAQPIEMPGLPNCHRVDDGVIRGAQPLPEGFTALTAMHVRTVVNLRSMHENRQACEAGGLGYVRIPQIGLTIGDEDAIAFLKVVTNPANRPIFVHCQHGADRTGTMVAVYRIVVQGWSKDDAIDELIRGGFGYHMVLRNLISYLQGLDVDKLRRETGLIQ